eukprot:1606284-Rhodomonas_salina.1
MPHYDGCIIPTENTCLKWNPDYSHIIGMQHLQPGVEERYRQRGVVTNETEESDGQRVVCGIKMPSADEVAYMREDAMDENMHVSVNVVTLVVSVIPVEYCTTKTGEDSEERIPQKETFWLATLIPQPGVNLMKCIEKVCNPFDSRCRADVEASKDSYDRWTRLCSVECFKSYNIRVHEWDHLFTTDSLDNYTDRRHPFVTMSTSS